MPINSKTLESGKEYTLCDLFSGKNKIIIPDLQRDYCWGDNVWNKNGQKGSELVSGFVGNLIDMFQKSPKEKLTLGLIYGYENPKNHIQLCDGQQRVTTLFLLLGILNRLTKENIYSSLLISDEELHHDDKEPYLQYSIRESTLYFLSDLVCEFFLKKDVKSDDISLSNWYFSEYNQDASIQSMLAAISIIEKKLEQGIDYKDFGDFITSNLQMLYYDMGDRSRGEETFVVINTTGEPLTATENLKPILLGNLEGEASELFSKEWEDREEWFWKNKGTKEKTSDVGLNDFFVWYWQINLLQQQAWKNKKAFDLNPKVLFTNKPVSIAEEEEAPEIENWENSIKLDVVHSYFEALKLLLGKCNDDRIKTVLRTIKDEEINLSWFRKADSAIILPLIAYLQKYPEGKLFYQFVRRIRKNYYDNYWVERRCNYIDWRHIIQLVKFSSSEEEVLTFATTDKEFDFKNISNISLNEWYNEEEQLKQEHRQEEPERIEEWEDHPDFMGDLSFLLSMQESVDINELEKYYRNYCATIDLVRNQ